MFRLPRPMERGVTYPPRAALHPVPEPGSSAALGELAAVLWQERELLEDLLFALDQQHRVVAAGDTRWLGRADAAVAGAAGAVRTHEVFRAIEVESLVSLLGLACTASLRDIAEVVDEPWTTVLTDHRDALRELATEIDEATERNRDLLLAGERATREQLEQV
jgi:hypothetical protein